MNCPECGRAGGEIYGSRSMPYGRRRRVRCDCGHRWTLYTDHRGREIGKPEGRREPRRHAKPQDEPVHFMREKLPRWRIERLLAEATTPAVQAYLSSL